MPLSLSLESIISIDENGGGLLMKGLEISELILAHSQTKLITESRAVFKHFKSIRKIS